MFPRPTPGGLLFLIITAVSVGVALMNVGLITALTASVFCAVTISSFLMSFFSTAGISLRRENMPDGKSMEKVVLPLVITNHLPWFRQSLILTEQIPFVTEKVTAWEIPSLPPKGTVTLQRETVSCRRGHFCLRKIRISGGDPCGIFKTVKVFKCPGEISIVPKTVLLSSFPYACTSGHSVNREGRSLGHVGQGNDFFGIRPYRAGDEMRFVHWRLSASKNQLMVREFEAAAVDKIVLILDTTLAAVGNDPVENNFEKLITIAASVTEYLSSRYCHLTFITRHDGEIFQTSGDAAGIRTKIQEILTEIVPSKGQVETLIGEILETLSPGTVVCFLGMTDSVKLRQMLSLLEDQQIVLQWIHAPKDCFPYIIDDEELVFCLPQETRKTGEIKPLLLTCQTDLEGIFNDEEAV